jgi:hypothetical protein
MRASCLFASGNLYVSVEPPLSDITRLPELPGQRWREQPAASSDLFRRGPGAAVLNLETGECGASW